MEDEQLSAGRDGAVPPTLTSGSLASKTVVGAVWLVGWRIVTRTLGIASTLILARVLTPGDFGLVAIATAFAAAIEAMSQLGLQDALVRQTSDGRELFDTAFTLQLVRATLTGAALALVAPFSASWLGDARLGPILLVVALNSFLSGLENVGIIEFRRAMRFDVQFTLLAVQRILQLGATISIALVFRSYWALLVGILVSRVVRVIMTYWVHPYRPKLRLTGWRQLAGFSFWTWANSVAAIVWDRAETFILGPAIGVSRLGLYSIGQEIAILPISEIVEPATDAMFAAFSVAQKHGQSSIHHAPLVAACLMMCVMPLTVTISCGAGYADAALLGPNWVAAQPLIAIMAWLCLFSPMSYVCNAVLIANNFVRRSFVVRVIAALIKLAAVLTTISLTSRLDVLAAVSTSTVMLESSAYMLALKGVGDVRLRSMAGPVCRMVLAGSFVMVCLYGSGFAWQRIELATLPAFGAIALYGSVVVAVYCLAVLALWSIAGRPAGPERVLIGLTSGYLRSSRARLRQLITAA